MKMTRAAGLAILILLLPLCSVRAQMTSPEVQNLSHDIFKQLIEINTTKTNGSTLAAEAMATRLLNAGFPDNDVKVIGPDLQHKNLVVRYRGTGRLSPVLFICHLDVVEALASDWSMNPFKFIEKDGFFYGRGTTDIKSEDADLVTNLIRLKKENFKPDRDIIVALTDCEEAGGFNGVDWLLNNHKDLIDADFCINPDGGGGDLKDGKPFMMYIQTSEKVYMSVGLEAKNKGGHSSLPVKDNAIYHLAEALNRLGKYDFPVNLNETTRKLFETQAQLETGQLKEDMLSISSGNTDTAFVNRLSNAAAYYNAMMRTTCVATMINGGHAENALPQSAVAIVNCRILPDDNPDSVLQTIRKVIADTSVNITLNYLSVNSPLSPLRDDVLKDLEKTTKYMWPEVIIFPVMSTGATDGRYLRKSGMPVYGISGIFGDPLDSRAHGRDERVEIKYFDQGVEFMYRFMKEVSSLNR